MDYLKDYEVAWYESFKHFFDLSTPTRIDNLTIDFTQSGWIRRTKDDDLSLEKPEIYLVTSNEDRCEYDYLCGWIDILFAFANYCSLTIETSYACDPFWHYIEFFDNINNNRKAIMQLDTEYDVLYLLTDDYSDTSFRLLGVHYAMFCKIENRKIAVCFDMILDKAGFFKAFHDGLDKFIDCEYSYDNWMGSNYDDKDMVIETRNFLKKIIDK